MRFLRNSQSIIIDLRNNTGGVLDQAGKFCSYFAPNPGTYFMSFNELWYHYDSSGIEREGYRLNSSFTSKKITNKFTRVKNIYILTSHRTFSAGEGVAYKIKKFVPDATVIGENTPGSGNGYSGLCWGSCFIGIVPNVKIFDQTNASFSLGTSGLAPDIPVHTDSAFAVAYEQACSGRKNHDAQRTRYLKKQKYIYEETNPYFKKHYDDYVGNYRKVSIIIKNNQLYLNNGYVLLPLKQAAENFFYAEGYKDIRFIRKDGLVSQIHIKRLDGYTEKFRKI
jgi:C-terminal processing protease CtpA/Prc